MAIMTVYTIFLRTVYRVFICLFFMGVGPFLLLFDDSKVGLKKAQEIRVGWICNKSGFPEHAAVFRPEIAVFCGSRAF
jgi:hypothetical protein